MKIEFEKIIFNSNLQKVKIHSENQKAYLSHLQSGSTLQQLVNTYLQHGWLVNFAEIVELLELLLENRAIENENIKQYFSKKDDLNFKDGLLNFLGKISDSKSQTTIDLSQFPFFRNLQAPLLEQFRKLSQKIVVPANTLITEQGKLQREFYILLRGEASVYKRNQNGLRLRISEIDEKSVFGEVGFLLGEPRTADVIAKTECELIQIQFNDQFFQQMIKKEIAESLQTRFWMLHALSKSQFFKGLPEDVFDSLIFAGKTFRAPADQVLFKEGDFGAECFIIIQGSVVFSQNGKTINVLGQGDCFGEIALFFSQGKRTATAKAQRECIFSVIDQNSLYRIMGQNILLGKELQLIAEARIRKDQERIS